MEKTERKKPAAEKKISFLKIGTHKKKEIFCEKKRKRDKRK
jgi:hypothetical protein